MATTVGITLVGFCAAQGHVTVDVTANSQTKRVQYEVADLRENIVWDDAERIVRDLLRLHFRGLTLNQARNELQAGISLVI